MLVQQIGGDDVDAIEQVPDALVGIVRRAAHDADDLVRLPQEELRQVRAVLPGDSGDERRASGLPRPFGRFSFRPLFRSAHFLSRTGPWLESATSVAKAP